MYGSSMSNSPSTSSSSSSSVNSPFDSNNTCQPIFEQSAAASNRSSPNSDESDTSDGHRLIIDNLSAPSSNVPPSETTGFFSTTFSSTTASSSSLTTTAPSSLFEAFNNPDFGYGKRHQQQQQQFFRAPLKSASASTARHRTSSASSHLTHLPSIAKDLPHEYLFRATSYLDQGTPQRHQSSSAFFHPPPPPPKPSHSLHSPSANSRSGINPLQMSTAAAGCYSADNSSSSSGHHRHHSRSLALTPDTLTNLNLGLSLSERAAAAGMAAVSSLRSNPYASLGSTSPLQHQQQQCGSDDNSSKLFSTSMNPNPSSSSAVQLSQQHNLHHSQHSHHSHHHHHHHLSPSTIYESYGRSFGRRMHEMQSSSSSASAMWKSVYGAGGGGGGIQQSSGSFDSESEQSSPQQYPNPPPAHHHSLSNTSASAASSSLVATGRYSGLSPTPSPYAVPTPLVSSSTSPGGYLLPSSLSASSASGGGGGGGTTLHTASISPSLSSTDHSLHSHSHHLLHQSFASSSLSSSCSPSLSTTSGHRKYTRRSTATNRIPAEVKETEEYKVKRERNNIAVRKSREKAKRRLKENESRAHELIVDNEQLRSRIKILSNMLQGLRMLLNTCGVSQEKINFEINKCIEPPEHLLQSAMESGAMAGMDASSLFVKSSNSPTPSKGSLSHSGFSTHPSHAGHEYN